MPLRNILAPRQQVQTGQGLPLAGGKVFLYAPGTTDFITSYLDSGLVVPHSNPVKLSGSGRANVWISRDCDLRITDRTGAPTAEGNLILEELNANPDALGTEESGGLIQNGSFEDDADADTIPDFWTLVSESGATNAIDTSESTDGAQSFRFTSSGVGGGSLTTTNFFPVNDVDDLRVNFDLRSSLATVRNIVRVEWYDISMVSISNSDIYDSTANPLTFTSKAFTVTPPALARFAKLRLIGIDPSVALSGSTFYDRASVFYPAVVSGIFDNLTLANNDIISTNTNGDINLTPNGTGRTVVKNLSAPDTLRVRSDIVTATPPVAEAVTGSLDIYDLDETDLLASLGYAGSNVLRIRNRMHGGALLLEGQNAAGTDRTILNADPDADTDLYGVGVKGLGVDGLGNVKLYSPTSTDTEIRDLLLVHQDGTVRGSIGHLASDILAIRNEIHGGNVQISAETAAGAVRTSFIADPDSTTIVRAAGSLRLEVNELVSTELGILITNNAGVGLYTNNLETARSNDGSLGGFLVNNLLTGGGFERALTTSDQLGAYKNAITSRDTTTTKTVDPDLSVPIGVGNWIIDWVIKWNEAAGASQGLKFDWRSTGGTVGGFRYHGYHRPNAANLTTAQHFERANAAELAITLGDSTERTMFGQIMLDVTVATTVELFWAQNVSSGSATALQIGSCMVVRKIP